MGYYIKKPITIEAREVTEESIVEIVEWIKRYGPLPYALGCEIMIPTLEGQMTASLGDWVIRGLKDEFYTCKPDVFEKTYDHIRG